MFVTKSISVWRETPSRLYLVLEWLCESKSWIPISITLQLASSHVTEWLFSSRQCSSWSTFLIYAGLQVQWGERCVLMRLLEIPSCGNGLLDRLRTALGSSFSGFCGTADLQHQPNNRNGWFYWKFLKNCHPSIALPFLCPPPPHHWCLGRFVYEFPISHLLHFCFSRLSTGKGFAWCCGLC